MARVEFESAVEIGERRLDLSFDSLKHWGDGDHFRLRSRPSWLSNARHTAPASQSASPITPISSNGRIRFVTRNRSRHALSSVLFSPFIFLDQFAITSA